MRLHGVRKKVRQSNLGKTDFAERDRQTDRQRDRQRERETEKERERETV